MLDGPRVVIGRDASRCQLVLEHALVSREHAVFETDCDGHVVIRDLDSRQGTFVNGVPVSCQRLRDGDSVGFGRGGMLAFRFQASASLVSSGEQAIPGVFSVQDVRSRLTSAGASAARVAAPAESSTVPSRPQTAPDATQAPGAVVRIGRAPDNDVVLDSPGVSRYHARVRYEPGGAPHLEDAGSTNGTFINGEVVRAPRAVSATDLIFVGGFLLRIDGRAISRHDLSSSRLIAAGITKKFGRHTVISDVSFAVFPREFVGLMGPSGCGKSTLMDALNGLRPATDGTVFIDELNLYQNFDAVRRSIGYVPQRDVLHDSLTVERTLQYAARLRLPAHTTPEDITRVVDDTIRSVGLADHRFTEFQQLSGGQQKRLSLAVELLTKPSFLFLDEPTSPLDPETSEQLMLLFRRLADEGRIVVMVTHRFERFEQMHQIALLTKGGRLAYFGPPTEALKYFGCTEPAQIYRAMAQREPDDVAHAFRSSPQYREYVTARLAQSQEALAISRAAGGGARLAARSPERAGLRQFRILAERYLEIKLRDRRNTVLLIAQAPAIAVILALIAGSTANDAKTLFVAALVAIWFGANNAVREVVAEGPIYRRERLVNLKIPSYLLSKFAVLSGFAVVQCLLLVITLTALDRLRWVELVPLLVTLSLTAFSGIGLGLLFSSIVNTTEKAMSVLPLILIPQLLLSGFMKPITDVYYGLQTGRPATLEEYERSGTTPLAGAAAIPASEPVGRIEGLGPGAYASALMGARWSFDALIHVVGATDRDSRARHASQLSVRAYEHVRSASTELDVKRAYQTRVLFCWLVLLSTTGACLAGAGGVLRRKDSL